MTAPDPSSPEPQALTFPVIGEVISFRGTTYRLLEEIGSGGFGKVYACEDDWDNKLAAKLVLPHGRTYAQVRDDFNAEFGRLINLRHPNVTFIHDGFEFKGGFYLILERCGFALGDLYRADFQGSLWLHGVAHSVLQAVDFLHRANIVHKDIHPGNVFVSFVRDKLNPKLDAMVFKLGDFGVSRPMSAISATSLFADWIRPPECIDSEQFGTPGREIDIYHCGLLLLSVLRGERLRFSKQEILDGVPRRIAEGHAHPCAPALARALRRHVASRTATPKALWKELVQLGLSAN